MEHLVRVQDHANELPNEGELSKRMFLRPGRRSRLASVIAGLFIVISVAALQISQRPYHSSLTAHPDEAAHFVTGVCVLDYFRTALGSNPVAFAESYYAHYPKVAFGHWPPGFYVIQAIWYALLGATTFNAILLAGAITAISALVLFRWLERLYRIPIALLSIAVFLWLPLVRASAFLVMSDMLASLFILLAVITFCEAAQKGRRRSWLAFCAWTALAVLTKESALLLLVLAPAALILLRPGIFEKKKLRWMGLAFGALISVLLLVYSATGVFRFRELAVATGFTKPGTHMAALAPFFQCAGIPVFLVAGFGILAAFFPKMLRKGLETPFHIKIVLLWLAATLASQQLFRYDIELRYYLPASFPLMILFADGLQVLVSRVSTAFGKSLPAFALAGAVAGACILSAPPMRAFQRRGYAEIAASMPYPNPGDAVLISSDSSGEGALIVERLTGDAARASVVLRASKMLATSDWVGRDYMPLMKSVGDVRDFLDTTPVRFVVLDMNGFIDSATRFHHRLLEETMREDPSQFRLVGNFPLYYNGRFRTDAVQVYENALASGRHAGTIRIDMGKTLGRQLNVQLNTRTQFVAAPPRPLTSKLESLLDRVPVTQASATRFIIRPSSDQVAPDGDSGAIYVTAPAGFSWSVLGAPDWLRITRGVTGIGDGMVAYTIHENNSNEVRSAAIHVGDAEFDLVQPRSRVTFTPFFEHFDASPPEQGRGPVARWVLEDQSGRSVSLHVTQEGPAGSNSLVVETGQAATDIWKTQIYVPRIQMKAGTPYSASLWLKSEKPVLLRLSFSRRVPPYETCGLAETIWAPVRWTQFTFHFRSAEQGCAADSNRLSIEAGRVSGKMWVANVSLLEEPPTQDVGRRR